MKSQILILLRIICTWWAVVFFLLSRFSLSFHKLITACLGLNIFVIIVHEACWASWMCRLMVFIIFGIWFNHYFNYSFFPFLISSGTPIVCRYTWYPTSLWGSDYYYFLFLFLFLPKNMWSQLAYLQINWFFFFCQLKYAVEFLYWNFHLSFCTFQLYNFCF